MKTLNPAYDSMLHEDGCPSCESEDTEATTATVNGVDNVCVCICHECGHTEEKYIATSTPLHKSASDLSDILSDCIERGVMSEDSLPEDYQAIIKALLELNEALNANS